MRLTGLVLLLSLITPLAYAAEDVVHIVLYPVIRLAAGDAEVSNETLPLARLARVIADRDTQRKLQNLEVPMSTFDGVEEIDSSRLMRVLADLPELKDAEIVGPSTIVLAKARDSKQIDKAYADAEVELREYVEANWPQKYRNLEYKRVGKKRELPIGPTSRYHFDFSGLERLNRRTPIWLVVDDGGEIERISIWLEVRGEVLVWVARNSLDARSPALESEFAQRWKNMSELNQLVSGAPSKDERLVTSMSEGEVLSAKHLELIPAVDFGNDTRVISVVGDVRIQTVATALETAYIGDLIAFRSNSSNQRFEARVLDKNLAQIERQPAPLDAMAEQR